MAWSRAAAIVGIVVDAVAGAFLLTAQTASRAQQAAETLPSAETQLTPPLLSTVLATSVVARGVVGSPKPVQNLGRPGDGRGSGVRYQGRLLRRGRQVAAAAWLCRPPPGRRARGGPDRLPGCRGRRELDPCHVPG